MRLYSHTVHDLEAREKYHTKIHPSLHFITQLESERKRWDLTRPIDDLGDVRRIVPTVHR